MDMSLDMNILHDIDPPSHGESGAEPGRRADVHIVGGGLAGLTAAAIVAKAGYRATVHERKRRVGGNATTDERDGYRFNQGPHALYRGGDAERVLRSLGIQPQGVSPELDGAQMLLGGELYLAPQDTGSLLRTKILGTADKARLARLLTRLPKLDPARYADHTVTSTVADLSGRPRIRQLLQALVRLSCYGNAPDAMSGDVAVMQLQRSFDQGVLYLHRGWQQLVDTLAATPGVTIAEGDPVRSLDELADSVDGGIGDDGAPVIVAAGGPRTAATITGHPYEPGQPALLASLDLALRRPPATSFVLGIDEPLYLSNHAGADGMAPSGAGSLTLGRYVPDADAGDEQGSDRDRLRAFAERVGVRGADIVDERYLHRMPAVTALPLATTGGLAGRPPSEVPGQAGVFVAGDWVGPHGHLGDAVVASAERAAVAALLMLDQRRATR